MARILSDRDVRKAIGSILIDADPEFLNPNGIELRLGKHARFLTTGEDCELQNDMFLRVTPGETVLISSFESLDFRNETVAALFPDSAHMGLITPTTTMMREGIAQVTTKIDPGFRGTLNWSLRNGSTHDLIVGFAEPMFKLTLFLLEANETPEKAYGERARDTYQDCIGVARSRRRIPSDIPKRKIVSSSVEKLDPTKRLQEAGYPFNHIAIELTELHGKFEIVSTDVRLLKDEFSKLDGRLSKKIDEETSSLSEKIASSSSLMLEKVEALLATRTNTVIGAIVAIGGLAAAGYTGLLASAPSSIQTYVFLAVAILALTFTLLISRNRPR